MSDIPESAPVGSDEAPPANLVKKPRPMWERVLVRMFILILVVLAGIEGSARWGYDQTMARLEAYETKQPEAPKPGTATVESLARGWCSQAELKNSKTPGVRLTWPSLFKPYAVDLFVSKEGRVTSFMPVATPQVTPAPVLPASNEPAADAPTGVEPAPASDATKDRTESER